MKHHKAVITIGLIGHLHSAEINWSVNSAGGADSSGGPYSITDTIGEALAGSPELNSEAYGFWAYLPPAPRTPQILITPLSGNQIEVSWLSANDSWILLQSGDLKEWKELGTTTPWTGPRKDHAFFRLQLPESK